MVHVYTDFDGTITRLDVGDAMFERFGGSQCVGIIEEYRSERISAAECFRRESAACATLRQEDLDAFLDAQEIDGTFAPFVSYCRDAGYPLTVLSDGMDYYIRRILERHGVGAVPFFSNHLDLVPAAGGAVSFSPVFPYEDEVCTRCACCKRNHILTTSGDEDVIVYIGEGYSDRCPARFADLVFAKDDLLAYCEEANISYFPYATFADIQSRLETMRRDPGERRLKRKRHQAALARREVYLGG